ncbi:MAG TPA: metallophosphoesterase [Xanthobacteraceae bacterium]|nr:metallophosphoesterase [Xanthobacteraceae bacterium]
MVNPVQRMHQKCPCFIAAQRRREVPLRPKNLVPMPGIFHPGAVVRVSFAIAANLAIPLLVLPPSAEARIFAQWVELGPDGASSVRAITDDLCPQVIFDGVPTPMSVRAEPLLKVENVKPAAFPVRSCEAAVPQAAVAATLGGRALPLARPNPQRIVVFGDTGCRLDRNAIQDCNDPAAWPFPKVAAAAANARPDLVIHVGDYHYREQACPPERSGCARSPWGYGFDAWYADFFEPAAPLFAAAPWIMVRGNHEDCARAGEGWIRFLDRLPASAICRDLTGIFVARLGDFGIVVVDGARAEDPKGNMTALAGLLHDQLADVAGRVPAEAWLVAHRPLNAMRSAPDQRTNEVENAVQELAFGGIMPPGVRMTVAGHIHFFQAVDFGALRPPQLVVGTGGDNLSIVPPLSVVGADINGRKVVHSVTYAGFAYMVWDRTGNLWIGTLFDADGKTLSRCRLLDRSLTCGT